MKIHTPHTDSAALAAYTSKAFLSSAIVVLSLALSACVGGKKATADEVAANKDVASQDITRPPQTIVGRKEVEEQNPEETISFDEWRKKRLEE